jgi:hypothetical protein
MSAGYGKDTFCFDEIQTGRIVTGAELVAQAVYRRLTTPRGTLRGGEEESIYGLDLLDFVGRVGSSAATDALPDVVEAEVLKDDRILSCTCTVARTVYTDATVALALAIDCTLRDEDEVFTLTLGVSDVAVSVVGLTLS